LFYEFSLGEHISANHLLRSIDRFVEGVDVIRGLGAIVDVIGVLVVQFLDQSVAAAKASTRANDRRKIPELLTDRITRRAASNLLTVDFS
jgi:hypothetical protein